MGKFSEFPTFVDEPPVISISGGVVLVSYKSGGAQKRAMSVRTFAQALERGQRALEQHARGIERVIVDS